MKKLLLSIALLASCASVMAARPITVTPTSGTVQIIDPVPQSVAGSRTPKVRAVSQAGPLEANKVYDVRVSGDGNVQLHNPSVRIAQPRG